MKLIRRTLVSALTYMVATISALDAQEPLFCLLETSQTWNSSWCDLPTNLSFRRGDRLRLTLGGTATRVLVRLLPSGADPRTSAGVLPEVVVVPASRTIDLVVPHDIRSVSQVSVHGGPRAWQVLLGESNGSATINGVWRLDAHPSGGTPR